MHRAILYVLPINRERLLEYIAKSRLLESCFRFYCRSGLPEFAVNYSDDQQNQNSDDSNGDYTVGSHPHTYSQHDCL